MVTGLQTVSLAPASTVPARFKTRRGKGAIAAGYVYQKKLGHELRRRLDSPQSSLHGRLFLNQWLRFTDGSGPHLAQPDAFIAQEAEEETPARIMLFEVKLSQTPEAVDQLRLLYRPLLERLYGLPVVMIQVFKNLRTQELMVTPEHITSSQPIVWNWHWIPRT